MCVPVCECAGMETTRGGETGERRDQGAHSPTHTRTTTFNTTIYKGRKARDRYGAPGLVVCGFGFGLFLGPVAARPMHLAHARPWPEVRIVCVNPGAYIDRNRSAIQVRGALGSSNGGPWLPRWPPNRAWPLIGRAGSGLGTPPARLNFKRSAIIAYGSMMQGSGPVAPQTHSKAHDYPHLDPTH